MRSWMLWCGLCLLTTPAVAEDAPPRSLDPRLKVTLFAEDPQIVTPTGIDVDHKGRVWAIESNTHFPPEGYKGHPSDRVLVMSDTDGDGRADRIVVFKDNIKHAMSVALRPLWFPASGGRQPPEGIPGGKAATPEKTPSQKGAPDDAPNAKKGETKSDVGSGATVQGADAPRSPVTSVYIATRRDVVLYHDDDGDDKADREERIVHLDSPGDYPHDGLAGFAFDALGWLHFGFGENLGAEYKLIGSDGTTLSGGGEGGSVYRCRLDGTKLERLATGFWNPHASCIDAFGRMFTVDNDPDSRPPCRLLHIIPGGDYGYRFRYGRKGLHPFSCWNGEIPGTLPMVAGTGEAPSGILAYESDGLPEEYIGDLLVTSWGDHRIDRFRLKPKGASFESLAEPLIVGGENFRPVGIACAPDGSLYFTDWMLRDYNVHGKGRVWRIEAVDAAKREVLDVASLQRNSDSELSKQLNESKRLDVRRMAASQLRRTQAGRRSLLSSCKAATNRAKIEALTSLALVPRMVENLEIFRILGPEPSVPRERFDEVTSVYWKLIGEDIPQHSEDADLDNPELEGVLLRSRSHDLAIHGLSFLRFFSDPNGSEAKRILDPGIDLAVLPYARLPLLSERPDAAEFIRAFDEFAERDDPFVYSALLTVVQKSIELTAEGAPVDDNEAAEKVKKDDQATVLKAVSDRLNPQSNSIARSRLAFLLAFRRTSPQNRIGPESALRDPDTLIRRAAVQWIAEEKLTDFRPQVEAILNDPKITADLFLATLAALEMLDGVPPAKFDMTPPGKYVLPLVKDEKRPAAVRALALRLVDPAEPALDDKLLGSLLASREPALQLEVVRTLQQSPVVWSIEPLRVIAADETAGKDLRAEAVAGLGRQTVDGKLPEVTRSILVKLMNGNDRTLQREALRSIRGFCAKDAEVKKGVEALAKGKSADGLWKTEVAFALDPSGGLRPPLAEVRAAVLEAKKDSDDVQAGRRGFYHANGAGCFKCHTVDGRGGKIGPDLSTIGRALTREKLLDSILDPSKEVAPQFVSWTMETADGKVHTGMLVHENEGKTVLGDAEGRLTELPTAAIVQRTAQKTSVMPEKLADRMTVQEFRDLLAFLESLK